jgi:hypothetical protein
MLSISKMDSSERVGKIPSELVDKLVEYRVRIFENLASDALTLVSIQLFVVSLFSSLYVGLSSNNANYEKQFLNSINRSPSFAIAIISYIIPVPLAIIIYHQARKKAGNIPNELIRRRIGPRDTIYERTRDGFTDYLNKHYTKQYQKARRAHGRFRELDSELFGPSGDHDLSLRTELEDGLDHPESDERRLRVLLSLCVLLTFTSIIFSITSLIRPIISVIGLFVAILGLFSIFYIIVIYLNIKNVLLVTDIIFEFAKSLFYFFSRSTLVLVYLRKDIFLISMYFLGMVAILLPNNDPLSSEEILWIPVLIISGIFGLIIALFRKL